MSVYRRHTSVLLAGAASIATGAFIPAAAQETGEPIQVAQGETRRLGNITVTATRREEGIQDVPIAVQAVSAEELLRAGVQDIRTLDTLSSSFNLNSSQTESQGTTIRIRGVGTTGNNTGLESAVGVFIDGVYLSRPGIALGDLLDLEQIEVLRGPQGTLFGRNTSAGALNITTQRPNLEEVEGFGNLTYGNFNAVNVQAGINVPLIQDELGFRLSGAYRRQDGFLESTTTGAESNNRNRYLIRGQVQWEPTSDITFRLIGDFSEANESCCDAVILTDSDITGAGAFSAVGLDDLGGIGLLDDGSPAVGFDALNERASNAEQFINPFQQWGISGELNWDFDFANLTYIGSYRDFRAESIQESDFVDLDIFSVGGVTAAPGTDPAFTDITTQTHEIRLQGSLFDDRLDWLFGFYYSDEQINEISTLTLGDDFSEAISANFIPLVGDTLGPDPLLFFTGGVDPAGSFATNQFLQSSQNWSLFTHNTIAITEQFDLTLGIRYTDENKDGQFNQLAASSDACFSVFANAANIPDALQALVPLAAGLTCFPFAVVADAPGAGPGGLPTPVTFDEDFNDEEFIWTVKPSYAFTPDINGYFSFTHGFKAGGFNLDPTASVGFVDPSTGGFFPGDPTFGSEEIDAFEFGLKSELFDGRLRANMAVFHQIISDFQVLEFTGVQFVTFNVDRALSTGVELELLGAVTDHLTLNSNMTVANARYPDDCAGDETDITVTNLCGADLTNAPEFVGIWGATYERPIGSNYTGFITGNVRFETDRRTSTQPTFLGTDVPLTDDIQEANTKLNLRVGFGRQDGLWTLELWANNLTDEQTRNVTFNVPLRGGTFLTPPFDLTTSTARGAFIQEPRTFGATIRTRF